MKQTIASLILTIGLIGYSNADYFDDWTNDDLCGWMESSSTPLNIQKEVGKREIFCSGGIEVSSLPVSGNYSNENGTVFPSPDSSLLNKLQSYSEVGDNQVMGSSY